MHRGSSTTSRMPSLQGTSVVWGSVVPNISISHHKQTYSGAKEKLGRNISKTSASVSSGFQTRETFETTRPQSAWFYCFRAFGNPMKHEAGVFEITYPTKKISLNYHLNKFSQFNYYIWDGKYAWASKKCVWCAWSYHLIAALWQFLNIQQPRSRYLAVCQFRATGCFAKQMAECRFRPRKTREEEEKCVASTILR